MVPDKNKPNTIKFKRNAKETGKLLFAQLATCLDNHIRSFRCFLAEAIWHFTKVEMNCGVSGRRPKVAND